MRTAEGFAGKFNRAMHVSLAALALALLTALATAPALAQALVADNQVARPNIDKRVGSIAPTIASHRDYRRGTAANWIDLGLRSPNARATKSCG